MITISSGLRWNHFFCWKAQHHRVAEGMGRNLSPLPEIPAVACAQLPWSGSHINCQTNLFCQDWKGFSLLDRLPSHTWFCGYAVYMSCSYGTIQMTEFLKANSDDREAALFFLPFKPHPIYLGTQKLLWIKKKYYCDLDRYSLNTSGLSWKSQWGSECWYYWNVVQSSQRHLMQILVFATPHNSIFSPPGQ